MNTLRNRISALCVVLVLFLSAAGARATECKKESSFKIPVETGRGFAAAFVGASSDAIILAGGSDFPDAFPWEGGKKMYSDAIWLIRKSAAGYECAKVEDAVLPRALAGGVSASLNGSLYCFGGSDGVTPSVDVLRLNAAGQTVKVDVVSQLPEDFVPAAAAANGGKIYVHGAVGTANALYVYNPSSNSWTSLPACPSRVISEGACFIPKHNGREEAIFLIGGRGTDEEGLHIASNVWEYLPTHNTWNRKADFVSDGQPVNLMYSSAVAYGSGHILVFGGDDGVEFIKRMELEKAQAATNILFGNATSEALRSLDEATLLQVFEGVPQFTIARADLEKPFVDIVADVCKVFPSKGECRKMVQGGGVQLNKEKVQDAMRGVSDADLIAGKYLLVQRGKKNYYLIIVE
jgi:N-acetylneuraminic acid mutarotase